MIRVEFLAKIDGFSNSTILDCHCQNFPNKCMKKPFFYINLFEKNSNMVDELDKVVRQTGYIGRMKKNIATMTPEEYKQWQFEVNKDAKQSLFALNMPFVYKKDGIVLAEYPDGKIEIIR